MEDYHQSMLYGEHKESEEIDEDEFEEVDVEEEFFVLVPGEGRGGARGGNPP